MPLDSATPTVTGWYWLSGVDVVASSEVGAVAAFGDSITDGTNSALNNNHRWTDELARRLSAFPGNRAMGVLNMGIAGGRLLHDFLGPNGLARFDRDALSLPGLTHVIVELGLNDIGEGWSGGLFPADEVTAEQIIQGHKQLIERAHSRGLSAFGVTLTPFEDFMVAGRFPVFSQINEAKRQAVNDWIRSSGAYDAVIDFDKVLRDPAAQSRVLAKYDSGDHVHPTDEGYKALADAIDLSLFRPGNRDGSRSERTAIRGDD
jgi:lysophospholipase L1-like esterase